MFLRQYQRQRKCFLSERELKRHCATHWREQRDWGPVIFDWFVLSMRMQVILDSSFDRPGSAPIWGGKKGEFRDWTIQLRLRITLDCWICHFSYTANSQYRSRKDIRIREESVYTAKLYGFKSFRIQSSHFRFRIQNLRRHDPNRISDSSSCVNGKTDPVT